MGRKLFRRKTVDDQQSRAIKQIQSKVRYISPPELKRFDRILNGLPAVSTNAITSFGLTNTIALGTLDSSRIGDCITIKRIRVKFMCYPTQLQTNFINNCFRVIIVCDNRYDGTVLNGSELLQDYSIANGSNTNMLATYNSSWVNTPNSRGKPIQILYDRVFKMESSDNRKYHMFSFDKSYKRGKKVIYEGTVPQNGQIFMYMFNGSNTIAANNSYYSAYSTVYYTDV